VSEKPFLFLGVRPGEAVADDEYRAMCQHSGLSPDRLHRVRVERQPLVDLDLHLDSYAGVILGGGPFNVTDPERRKTAQQVRVEADLHHLLDELVARDFPFLGCCYGIGTLGAHQGAVIDRGHPEPIGRVPVTLTQQGRSDPLFGQLPDTFEAVVGHKEAVAQLPPTAVLLASSATCPVQAFRVKTNLYATQFHPEADPEGICLRIDTYTNHGYFAPGEGEQVKATIRSGDTPAARSLLAAFVQRFG
jgi:GMP synthase (glutamine-hydrolysing)